MTGGDGAGVAAYRNAAGAALAPTSDFDNERGLRAAEAAIRAG